MLDDQSDRRQRSDLINVGRVAQRCTESGHGAWRQGSVPGSVLALPFLRALTGSDRRAGAEPTDSILNGQAYAVHVLLIDAAAIIAMSIVSGVAYDVVILHKVPPLLPYMRNGLIVAILFFVIAMLKGASLPVGTSLAYERARLGLSAWIDAFVLFLFLAFALKAGATLSRGATLLFFLGGLLSVALTRANGPGLVAQLADRNALANRDIIVVGPQNDPALAMVVWALQRTLCETPYVVPFDDSCAAGAWSGVVADVLRRALKVAHSARPGDFWSLAAACHAKGCLRCSKALLKFRVQSVWCRTSSPPAVFVRRFP
ncbi:MAG: hypothetical protein KGJ78_00275 [Alphaproteobacteria bacterium]|nr:hypothetical protein [Alphaproteobacteria bacterium]